MINSMTGYGKGQAQGEKLKAVVELRGVNSRFLDISVKGLRRYLFLEEEIKKTIKKHIKRGKIDVAVNLEFEELEAKVRLNENIAKSYIDEVAIIKDKMDIVGDIRVSTLVKLPEVFSIEQQILSDEILLQPILKALMAAVDNFVEMRRIEGGNLAKDIVRKCSNINKEIEKIQELSSDLVTEIYKKRKAKMEEILDNFDDYAEEKLIFEAGVYAEKAAVDEEIVRLRSHIGQLVEILEGKEDVEGKKLDFISQEINREANTIGSKSGNLEITRAVVNIKGENEKIREQVQNIE